MSKLNGIKKIEEEDGLLSLFPELDDESEEIYDQESSFDAGTDALIMAAVERGDGVDDLDTELGNRVESRLEDLEEEDSSDQITETARIQLAALSKEDPIVTIITANFSYEDTNVDEVSSYYEEGIQSALEVKLQEAIDQLVLPENLQELSTNTYLKPKEAKTKPVAGTLTLTSALALGAALTISQFEASEAREQATWVVTCSENGSIASSQNTPNMKIEWPEDPSARSITAKINGEPTEIKNLLLDCESKPGQSIVENYN